MTAVNNSFTLKERYPEVTKSLSKYFDHRLEVVQLIFDYVSGLVEAKRLDIPAISFYPLRQQGRDAFFHAIDANDEKKLLFIEITSGYVPYLLLKIVIPEALKDVPIPGEDNQLIARHEATIYGVYDAEVEGTYLTVLTTWSIDPAESTLTFESADVIRRNKQEDTLVSLEIDNCSSDTVFVGFQSGHITFVYPKVVFQFCKTAMEKNISFFLPMSAIPLWVTLASEASIPKCGPTVVGYHLVSVKGSNISFRTVNETVPTIKEVTIQGAIHSVRALLDTTAGSVTLAHNAEESLIHMHLIEDLTHVLTFETSQEINTLFVGRERFLVGTGSRFIDSSDGLYVFS